jgi:integrase/recombinase XerD
MMRAIESYLEVRRAAGYSLRSTASTLRSFGRFASSRGEMHVRSATAIEWAGRAPIGYRYICLRTVVHFARHVRAEDDRHEIPPQQFFRRTYQRPLPFIFSRAQVRCLVEAATDVDACCPATYSTLFGLLAVTGLRVSEALALQLGDLEVDGLIIRQTKFRKDRLVPLHETTRRALERYLIHRKKVRVSNDHFFLSPRGRRLRYECVHEAFTTLVKKLGLLSQHGPRPRIHSLRHSFAVHALEKSPSGRERVARHMLALSTYLGHSSVEHTYWYLQATPELMSDIAAACEQSVEGVAL